MLAKILALLVFVGAHINWILCGIATARELYEYTQLKDSARWIAPRLANPCGISRASTSIEQSGNLDQINKQEYYKSMFYSVESAFDQLKYAEAETSNSQICEQLENYPGNPESDTELAPEELLAQVYQSSIYLLAHLEIMGLDRKTNGTDDVELGEEEPTLACNGESDSFLDAVILLAIKMEDVLCTLEKGMSDSQFSKFQKSFEHLLELQIPRFRSSCTDIVMRDCLVLREAHHTLEYFLRKFNQLIAAKSENKNQRRNKSLYYYSME